MKNTIQSFQGLRAIAALMILFSHLAGRIPVLSSLAIGANAVSIFIMLSGFLAVYSHETMRQSSTDIYIYIYTSFKKKLKKFYPLHLITYIATLPVSFLLLTKTPNPLSEKLFSLACKSIPNLLLIQSFIPVQEIYFSFNQVSWYLSDTMFFCFCTPFILRFLHQKISGKIPQKIALSFGILFILQFLISLSLYKTRFAHAILYISPLYRIGEFIQGALLGYLFVHIIQKTHRRIPYSLAQCSCAGLFLFLVLKWGSYPDGFGYSVIFVPVTAALLLSLATEKGILSRFLSTAPFQYLGSISFELFLTHFVVIQYLSGISSFLLPLNDFAFVVLALIGSIAVSDIMHRFLKLLPRIFHNP